MCVLHNTKACSSLSYSITSVGEGEQHLRAVMLSLLQKKPGSWPGLREVVGNPQRADQNL